MKTISIIKPCFATTLKCSLDGCYIGINHFKTKPAIGHWINSNKPDGGDEIGGKAVPWVTSIVHSSTIVEEVPIKLFKWALELIQAAILKKHKLESNICSSSIFDEPVIFTEKQGYNQVFLQTEEGKGCAI